MSEIRDQAARDCYCDARFSGYDDTEYRARGCPRCTCNPDSFKAGYDYAKRNDPDVLKLVDALEFYAGPWGIHHGFSDSINEVIQKVLNEKTVTATKAISAYRKAIEGEK